MTLGELVEKLGGRLTQGSPAVALSGVESSGAAKEQDLVFAEDAASATKALAGAAGALVLKLGCLEGYGSNLAMAVVEADQPRLWFESQRRACIRRRRLAWRSRSARQ
jgi:UDP-3-O-[3-hydroxymyristoyl] glucosamine N-acyltransferase